MTTWELKVKLKRKLKRPVHTEELNEIADKLGKTRPKAARTGGQTAYEWAEEEITEVINALNNL